MIQRTVGRTNLSLSKALEWLKMVVKEARRIARGVGIGDGAVPGLARQLVTGYRKQWLG